MPPIPVLLLVGIVLLLLFFMVCQEGCRALQTGDRGNLLKGVTSLPAWQGRNKILQEEDDEDQESGKQKQDKMSVKQASVFVIHDEEGEDNESEDMESSEVTKSPLPSASLTWDQVMASF